LTDCSLSAAADASLGIFAALTVLPVIFSRAREAKAARRVAPVTSGATLRRYGVIGLPTT